ncbi:hypothetical protein [Sinorhizobium medicae]|uniref:hypothetical protein n=1 Tax=Sinorhizobium medicae TaxID=110321 RepID=UPI000C7DF337|nr:hypothetical protein [Sinorhizobium medicae]MDX0425157.1 hypothetical protein [Sinorhizobium medicae]PLT95400.1 hypothetical protein BMJ32_30185 [Sinorhizobium medicae]PLU55107.1 hypothetical protein BMJ23_18515 [Sinorhizobium medicae]PLU65606.1 hypothetical protein BMJ21_20925 [Sinorhizobium medicae]TWA21528.1 hypothetical protein FB006_11160 [Sinorhizobium medicae]
MSLAADIMTKSAFAAHVGVSAGRISQYIAERKIFGDALEGEGRNAKIRASVAVEQLRKTLDPSQRFGANGAATRSAPVASELSFDGPEKPKAPVKPTVIADPFIDEVAAEKLKQQKITTARMEREEALELGRYMLTDDARREMVKAVAEAFKVMEQAIPEMAKAIAAQFSMLTHDATHVLLKAFRDHRAKKARDFADAAAELEEHVEDEQQ